MNAKEKDTIEKFNRGDRLNKDEWNILKVFFNKKIRWSNMIVKYKEFVISGTPEECKNMLCYLAELNMWAYKYNRIRRQNNDDD